MQTQLSAVSAAVSAALERRRAALTDETAALLERIVAALAVDYGDPVPPDPYDSFDRLSRVFGLDEPAQRLVAVAAAPDFDANLGRAFELLGGDPDGRPTVALAAELAGIASRQVWHWLNPVAPLREHGLLALVGTGPVLRRRLAIPDRLVGYLAGLAAPSPQLQQALRPAVPVPGPAATQLAEYVNAGARVSWVRSGPGAAGAATAVAGFGYLGLSSLVLDLRSAADTATVAEALLEVSLHESALVLLAGDGSLPRDIAALVERAVAPVAVISPAPPPGGLSAMPAAVSAPPLTAADRAPLWEAALGGTTAADPAVTALRLTPEEIRQVAAQATALAGVRNREVGVDDVLAVARALGPALATLPAAARTGRAPTLADLVLPERVHAELTRLVRWVAHRDEVLTRGPVHGLGGKGSGLAALFTGGPGTGKTLAAHAVAAELNLELLQIDLAAVVDKYVGETEKHLDRLFAEAESRNVVLFFDEADALFGQRSNVRDAHDRYANQGVSYLLQRMEQFDGVSLLATNLRGNVDAAFSRRLHFVVHFPDPDVETRQRLWEQHLRLAGPMDPADPIDLAELASTVELSGGDIRNIVLAAVYDAASDGADLGLTHLWEATVREYQKLGRRAPERAITSRR